MIDQTQLKRDELRQIVERWWDTHPLNDTGWIPIALALAQTQ
jgi:hypothetical protein